MGDYKFDVHHDYYADLGLQSTTDLDAIKSRFRELAKERHPDKNLSDRKGATEKFQEINAAYEILGNPQSRYQYDIARVNAGYGRSTKPPGSNWSFRAPTQRQDPEAPYARARNATEENASNQSRRHREWSNQTRHEAPQHEREQGSFGKRRSRRTDWTGNPRGQPQARHYESMGGRTPGFGRRRAATTSASGEPFMNAPENPLQERRSRFYAYPGGAKTRLYDPPVEAKQEKDGPQCRPRSASPPPTHNVMEDEEMPDAPWWILGEELVWPTAVRITKDSSDGGSDNDVPEIPEMAPQDTMRHRRIAGCRRRNYLPRMKFQSRVQSKARESVSTNAKVVCENHTLNN